MEEWETNYLYSDEKQIVLDPSATLAERQKSAELQLRIEELQNLSITCCEESGAVVSVQRSETPSDALVSVPSPETASSTPEEKIKEFHPGRSSFLPGESCCIFSEETLNFKDFKRLAEGTTNSLFEYSDLSQFIIRNHLQSTFNEADVEHSVCLYLFLLASVHPDTRVVICATNTILQIRSSWFPSVDVILTVFINWGLSPEFAAVENIDGEKIPFEVAKKLPGKTRDLKVNVQRILGVVNRKAGLLVSGSEADELNRLIQVLVVAALVPGCDYSYYGMCISSLFQAIPSDQWTAHKVRLIVEVLHREGAEDFHNQTFVCCELLLFGSRIKEVARKLACWTLNHVLAAETGRKPLDWDTSQNIMRLVFHFTALHTLRLPLLYLAVKLIDFCVTLDYYTDNMTLDMLKCIIQWLSELGSDLRTQVQSETCNTVKELLSRSLLNCRIMKTEAQETSIQSLCNPMSTSSSGEEEHNFESVEE